MGNVIPLRRDSGRYAAAKTSRSNNGWRPVDLPINELIAMAGPTVRARIRQLIRDFPYFARAKRIITDFVVGEGISLQSRVLDRAGNYIPQVSQQIEDAYNWWADEADIAGKLHLKEMERLARDQETECGEFIIVKTRSTSRHRYLPFALQMFEADWLTSYGAAPAARINLIDQGVEYNKDSGEIVAYHFTDPDGYGRPRRIPAEDVIHGFETLRPGQLRGISPFTPGVIVTRDLADCMQGEIDGFKFASKWLAFVKSMDPLARQLQSTQDSDTEPTKKIEELENSIIEYLRPGEDVVLASNPRPSGNLTPFVRLVLSMLSVATGVPFELLTGDYSGLNWAVIKVVRADFKHVLKPISARHIRQHCFPIFRAFMDEAVLAGRLSLPGYFANPRIYQRSIWQPPVADPVDRLRDTKSDVDEMDSLLRSPQEIVGARGRQYEDVLKELAAAKELRDKYQLTEAEVSTALAGNPAAISEE